MWSLHSGCSCTCGYFSTSLPETILPNSSLSPSSTGITTETMTANITKSVATGDNFCIYRSSISSSSSSSSSRSSSSSSSSRSKPIYIYF